MAVGTAVGDTAVAPIQPFPFNQLRLANFRPPKTMPPAKPSKAPTGPKKKKAVINASSCRSFIFDENAMIRK